MCVLTLLIPIQSTPPPLQRSSCTVLHKTSKPKQADALPDKSAGRQCSKHAFIWSCGTRMGRGNEREVLGCVSTDLLGWKDKAGDRGRKREREREGGWGPVGTGEWIPGMSPAVGVSSIAGTHRSRVSHVQKQTPLSHPHSDSVSLSLIATKHTLSMRSCIIGIVLYRQFPLQTLSMAFNKDQGHEWWHNVCVKGPQGVEARDSCISRRGKEVQQQWWIHMAGGLGLGVKEKNI